MRGHLAGSLLSHRGKTNGRTRAPAGGSAVGPPPAARCPGRAAGRGGCEDPPHRNVIVAFSGEHEYAGKNVTEASLNGFPSSQIKKKFREDPDRFLIVAEKASLTTAMDRVTACGPSPFLPARPRRTSF